MPSTAILDSFAVLQGQHDHRLMMEANRARDKSEQREVMHRQFVDLLSSDTFDTEIKYRGDRPGVPSALEKSYF